MTSNSSTGTKIYSPAQSKFVGTTKTGLDQIVQFISNDPGLAGANTGEQIFNGAKAADGLNKIIVDGLKALGIANKTVFTSNDVIALNGWIRNNRRAEFITLHGDDEDNLETGFHLVQDDGAIREYQGNNFVDTVADGLYHIGFEIKNGAFLNEDGDSNATVSQVAEWLTELYTDRTTTNTGLDRITELIIADEGLSQNNPWSNIAGGADAANGLNNLYATGITTLGLGSDGNISTNDIIAINNWIRSDKTRYATFVQLHGNDENGVETGFHLVQDDGANTPYFGENLVDTVADGMYHIGFEIKNGAFLNEDGMPNAMVKDVADWANYFYSDQSTTGTGLDQIVDIIKIDPGLARWTNAGQINSGADAANSLNKLIVDGIVATGVNADGWITSDDIRTLNAWVRANRYQQFVDLHGDDEDDVETGFHQVQNDGGEVEFFGENLINTVADGIYHIGFEIYDDRFVNEDGDANASIFDVASWLNYFYGGKTLVYGTWEEEKITGTSGADNILAYDGNDTIDGGNGNDLIYGGCGDDVLSGGAGDDIIYNYCGEDILDGGDGSDRFVVAGNLVDEGYTFQGYDTYQDTGNTGIDQIVVTGPGPVDIGLETFAADSGIEIIDGTGTDGQVRLLGHWDENDFNFTNTSLQGANILIDGGGGDDKIVGSQGADSIKGSWGNDELDGGNGGDTYIVSGNNPTIWDTFEGYDTYEDTGSTGSDKIAAIGTGAVDIGLKSFGPGSGIEVIDGTGAAGIVRLLGDWEGSVFDFSSSTILGSNVRIEAGDGDDTVVGTKGADTIVSDCGWDSLNGGEGDDTYIVIGNINEASDDFTHFDTYADTGTTKNDRIVAQGSGRVDIGVADYTSDNGIDVIDGTGAAGGVRVLGDWEGNKLDLSATKFEGSNFRIDGADGNDTIVGTAGNESIIGGNGDDSLNGANGGDTYIVTGNTIGTWSTFTGFDTYADTGTTGTDKILAQGTGAVDIGLKDFTPSNGIESIDGTGATGPVRLLGNWENNTLNFSGARITGTTANPVRIDGGDGNDTITGTSGNDIIAGGRNEDILNGGNGADTYVVTGNVTTNGWTFGGYDTYADTGAVGVPDRITVSGTGPVDIGVTTFGPSSGIEIIDGKGVTTPVRVLGNWEANSLNFTGVQILGTNVSIDGGEGDDTITGTAGSDTIIGGKGWDSLNGSAGGDIYRVTGNRLNNWSSFSGYDTYADSGSAITGGSDRIVAFGTAAVDIGLLNFVPTAITGTNPIKASGIEVIDGSGITGKVTLLGNWDSNRLDFSGTSFVGSNIVIDGADGNDTLVGNASNNVIIGGSGDDSITGGNGADTLTGGSGRDTFVYISAFQTPVGATARDTIADFNRSSDKLDLSALDANTLATATGNQAFSYIASGAFTGVAGQLRLQSSILSGDTNADKIADFEIALTGVTSLSATKNIVL